MNTHNTSLRITEIFYSLQGETRTMGLPTVFIRLTGCPLRCSYCDTAYAFEGGAQWNLHDILRTVATYQPRYVTVTGGEPLAQPNVFPLLEQLCQAGYEVSLETGGAMPIDKVDHRAITILDLKTPASGEMARNHYENIAHLKKADQVKFVICDRQDYEWARLQIDILNLVNRVSDILFSPAALQLEPATLANWILEDRLSVRMQLQLHKLIWGDERGR
jgi:7-carboxy-7-deazaguanine synthase